MFFAPSAGSWIPLITSSYVTSWSVTQASVCDAAPQTNPAFLIASCTAFFTGIPSGASSPLKGRSAPSLTIPTTCFPPRGPTVQPAMVRAASNGQTDALDAEVGPLNVRTFEQGLGRPLLDDPTRLEDVSAVCHLQRLGRILFDQEDRGALLVDIPNHVEDRIHEDGGQTQ